MKVFEPDDNSVLLNEAFTQNFFFGNFGIKHLVNSISVDTKTIKNMKISMVENGKNDVPVMDFHYSTSGKLKKMEAYESLVGEKVIISYTYNQDLLEKEIIEKNKEQKIKNFYYKDGKMIVEDGTGILDVYGLQNAIMTKLSYLDGKLIFNDRMERKCRVTYYQRKDKVNKVCFNDLDKPTEIEEFVAEENITTGTEKWVSSQILKIVEDDENNYTILNNDKKEYILTLNNDLRITEFSYLGSKEERKAPVQFKFNYIYY